MFSNKRFCRWFLCLGMALWFVVFHKHGGFVHQAFLLIGGFIEGLKPELVKPYDLMALQNEFDHFFKGADRHDLKCIMSYTHGYDTFLYTIKNHW